MKMLENCNTIFKEYVFEFKKILMKQICIEHIKKLYENKYFHVNLLELELENKR